MVSSLPAVFLPHSYQVGVSSVNWTRRVVCGLYDTPDDDDDGISVREELCFATPLKSSFLFPRRLRCSFTFPIVMNKVFWWLGVNIVVVDGVSFPSQRFVVVTSMAGWFRAGAPGGLGMSYYPKALSARGRKKPTFVLPHPLNYVIMYFFLRMGC